MDITVKLLAIPFATAFVSLLGANVAIIALKLAHKHDVADRVSSVFYPLAAHVRLGGNSEQKPSSRRHA